MKKFMLILVLTGLGLLFIFTKFSKGAESRHSDIGIVPANESIIKSDRIVKKEFDVKPGGKVIIDLKTGGAIKIEGWDKNVVSAEVTIKREDPDNPIEVIFDQSGDQIEITSDFREHESHHQSSSSELLLYVPNKFNIDFTTMGGGVTAKSVEGKLEGKTMGGSLNFSKLTGNIEVQTMGGSISLEDSEVDGSVKTMGGSVSMENIKGDVDASSMGGSIKQNNVQGKNKSIGKEVNISTMGGSIDIDDAPNGAHVKTMGGEININKAAKYVYAETMGGGIKIKAIDGGVDASTMGGDVDVTMVGNPSEGERNVSLSSKGGDITLYVPASLSMDIDIEITVEKNHQSDDFEIESDFPINQDRSKEWHNSKGSRKKYIRGTGSVEGGKNKIKIRTINGNVYLKKA